MSCECWALGNLAGLILVEREAEMCSDGSDGFLAPCEEDFAVEGQHAARESLNELRRLRMLHEPCERGDLQVGKLELLARGKPEIEPRIASDYRIKPPYPAPAPKALVSDRAQETGKRRVEKDRV